MRSLIALLFLLSALLLLSPGSLRAAERPGAMFRADPRHTGVWGDKPVAQLTGVKWKFETTIDICITNAI